MKKKHLLLIAAAGLLAFSAAACTASNTDTPADKSLSEQEDPERNALYDYITDNLGYTVADLRVVNEDDGYHVVINVAGTPDQLQELCQQAVDLLEKYADDNDISISVINPVILTSGDVAFGWSTNGTLYSTNKYPIAENVSLEDIASTLSNSVDTSVYHMPTDEEVATVADEDIEWEIVSTQDYVRDSKACIGYRVYINTDRASELQYRSIFEEITKDDKSLHTVWFYFSKSAADGSEEADVIMEQTIEGITPFTQK